MFGVGNKLLTVTFDDAESMTVSANIIEQQFRQPFNEDIFHNRCICHVLNLVVQSALANIKNMIEYVRTTLMSIKSVKSMRDTYKRECKATGMRCNGPIVDCTTRWNSTHDMLKFAVEYKVVVNRFLMGTYGPDSYISDESWEQVRIITLFLEPFRILTDLFSGVYYPTSHVVVTKLIDTLNHLDNEDFQQYDFLKDSIKKMYKKIKKYFNPLPNAVCIAYCFDPRIKLEGLSAALNELYQFFGNSDEADKQFATINDIIRKKYDYYVSISPSHHANRPQPREKEINPFLGFWMNKWNKKSKGKSTNISSSSSSCSSEFSYYFGQPSLPADEEVDILQWWKDMSIHYPVLSIMARDYLTIPVSSVASEAAFSQGRKQLSEYRSRLAGTTMEVICSLKDWRAAERRTQHLTSLADDHDQELGAMISLTSNESSDNDDIVLQDED